VVLKHTIVIEARKTKKSRQEVVFYYKMSNMPRTKKAIPQKNINQKRRSQLEYFSKAAAAIAGISLLPTIATSAVSFKKGTAGASTLWLADDGNVGIGTISPGEKLEVNGNLKLTNQTLSPTSVTFDSTTTTGLRITNPNGYVSLTPLNTSWAHIYTDRANFIFNTPVYSLANAFSSYNADLLLRRVGTTKITAGASAVDIADVLTVNGTGHNYFAGTMGFGTTSAIAKINMAIGAVGANAGDQTNVLRVNATTSNQDYLEITNSRVVAGTDWVSAGFRIQQKVDSTWMGYMQFNGNNSGGVSFGAGTSTTSANSIPERVRINSSGNMGLISSIAILTVGGTAGATTGTGTVYAGKVYGAVWNDIADYLEVDHDIKVEFGRVYVRDAKGQTRLSKKRCEKGVIGIASDTYGMSVGKKGKGKKEIPIALAGIVLAYVDKEYISGTPLVCTKEGKLTKAGFFDRSHNIIAKYYKPEKQKKWNGVVVNGRHWVKIK
jgi:hypothetical protein